MVDLLKAHWFEALVALYIVLGVLAPVVAKFSPRVGVAMGSVGFELGRLLSAVRPGFTPPELPKSAGEEPKP